MKGVTEKERGLVQRDPCRTYTVMVRGDLLVLYQGLREQVRMGVKKADARLVAPECDDRSVCHILWPRNLLHVVSLRAAGSRCYSLAFVLQLLAKIA